MRDWPRQTLGNLKSSIVPWLFLLTAKQLHEQRLPLQNRVSFLESIPYLAARLDEPGIRDRCIQRYRSAPPETHHNVSRLLFDPSDPDALACDVAGMNSDGSGMSHKLSAFVSSLAAIPIDDTVGESPHAKAARVINSSSSSAWPWVVATMRLRQNINDVDDFVDASDPATLAWAWTHYKSVVQVKTAKLKRTPT